MKCCSPCLVDLFWQEPGAQTYWHCVALTDGAWLAPGSWLYCSSTECGLGPAAVSGR